MRDYVIATASTCDLDRTWLDEHQVPFISYTFIIDDHSYNDDCTEKTKEFILDQMKQDKPVSTAAISVYAYEQFFEKILQQGRDIIFLDMTKALSSSFSNAVMASRDLQEKYPDRKIAVIDTNAVTLILGLLLKEAVAMHESGSDFDEVVSWIETNKNNFVGRFMVNDLKWLRRGGRLSNASAIVGSLLSIKPLIIVDDDGKLVAYNKIRGRQKCLHTLIEDVAKSMTDETPKHETAVIFSGEKEDGEAFRQEFMAAYPDLHNVGLYRLGPVIMGHIGPGFLAVVIYGKGREPKA